MGKKTKNWYLIKNHNTQTKTKSLNTLSHFDIEVSKEVSTTTIDRAEVFYSAVHLKLVEVEYSSWLCCIDCLKKTEIELLLTKTTTIKSKKRWAFNPWGCMYGLPLLQYIGAMEGHTCSPMDWMLTFFCFLWWWSLWEAALSLFSSSNQCSKVSCCTPLQLASGVLRCKRLQLYLL